MSSYIIGVILLCTFSVPFLARAQAPDLHTEIRAALFSADGAQNLTDDEFAILSNSLTARAQTEQVSAGDVALSRSEALFVESPVTDFATSSENSDLAPLVGTIALFAILWLALSYWRRMHHGGALGHQE